MKKTALTIAVISMLVLSACADTAIKDENSTYAEQNPFQQATPDALSIPEQTNIGEVDQAIIQGAITLKDEQYCDKISSEDAKRTCIAMVTDEIIKLQAVAANDPELCQTLNNKEDIEICKVNVDIAKISTQESAARNAIVNKDIEVYNKIQEERNFDNCKSIQTDYLKESCERDAIFIEALEKDDITICQKNKPEIIPYCEKSFNDAKAINGN